MHNIDIICLSETFLISETLSDDRNLEKPEYNLIGSTIRSYDNLISVMVSAFTINFHYQGGY